MGKNGTNNYIYEKNKINGTKIIDYNKQLTKEQLLKENTYKSILNFDDNYDYNDLNNKLPLLKNRNKTNILPNQDIIYIDNDDISIKQLAH